jgi:hypothetical protein
MATKTSWICLPLFLISSMLSHAQSCQWRPEGTIGPGWYDGGGSPCSSTPQQSAAPTVRWSSRWGAVANSITTGHAGTSAGQVSRYDAKHLALHQCGTDDGIKDCKIVMTYHDQCAAIADGTYASSTAGAATTSFATASAATISEASNLAMESCNKEAIDCKVIYTECSLPERIQ